MKAKKIVITGGPATGKTTIIEQLQSLGYQCYEEVIRKLTAAAQESGDISEAHSNPIALVSDALSFNETLIKLRLKDYNDAKKTLNFFDRGTPDVLAYMTYFKQDIPKEFSDICSEHVYDKVFILPPWLEIYKDDAERFETFKQATDIYHHLKDTYIHFNHEVIEVPFGSIQDRTQYIINSIS